MAQFDRSAEDVGNVLALEHVNLTVPDQGLAALFYVTGLGFTRDPYIDFGTRNMWINAGRQQFHLPLGEPQRFRGRISVVVPDLDDLQRRLDRLFKPLAGTCFDYRRDDEGVHVRCPWGNDILANGPQAFAPMVLGLPRVEVDVAVGAAAGIGRFYRQVIGCPATDHGDRVEVRMGANQRLMFRESDAAPPAYDGHHIAVYVASFSGPHDWLAERQLVTEESDAHQYRFQAIVDPDSGATLTELEHEVRSLGHPMYDRPLVNRDPAVGFFNYRQGSEVFKPA